jgi:hypothetical protein
VLTGLVLSHPDRLGEARASATTTSDILAHRSHLNEPLDKFAAVQSPADAKYPLRAETNSERPGKYSETTETRDCERPAFFPARPQVTQNSGGLKSDPAKRNGLYYSGSLGWVEV